MVGVNWKHLIFSAAHLVAAQSTGSQGGPADGLKTNSGAGGMTTMATRTSTVGGSQTTYSVQFTVPASADEGPNLLPNVQDPNAKNAQALCPGYKASNVTRTQYGLTGTLTLAGAACNVYGTDIDTLDLNVDVQSDHRLHISIKPTYLDSTNTSYYILPENLVDLPSPATAESNTEDIDLQFNWSNEPSFSFNVVRKSTGDKLFDTTGSHLVYSNQFIEFVTFLPENYNLYGMGERMHGYRLSNNFTATFFAADAGDPIDRNIYGNHPVYVDTRYYEVNEETGEKTLVTSQNVSASGNYQGYTHAVYQRNAHPMEAILKPSNLTWRALGGAIDLYIFDGPTPEKAIQQYQQDAVGLPAMHQYWTFGFHQCRWGYANWSELADVVQNYRNANIPLETIWTDIDYMDQYRDFTWSPTTFPAAEGKKFVDQLSANGQHYIPIIDAAVYIPNPDNSTDAYTPYNRGNDVGAFLSNPDGSQYIGSVWPGYTVFPDWHNPNTTEWWINEVVMNQAEVPYSGIWIDMSEVSSFCVGSCGSGNLTLNPVHPPFQLPGEPGNIILDYPEGFNLTNATEAASASSASMAQSSANAAKNPSTASSTTSYYTPTVTPGQRNVNQPPYVINNVNGDLAVHAVSPNATHSDGVLEYDVHNLYGHQLLNATYKALQKVFPGKRPFIIGRSTFVGSGKWAGHWGGDNTSLWAYMYLSIAQAFNFNIFGIPHFGVDTCGFNGNSDEELCNRWMQLSALMAPFYRNHNTLSANPQEAYVWASVAEASRKAMAIRYALLPYLYTVFYHAHSSGTTVTRPLSYEFPDDPTLANIDNQFLLGSSILVTPVLGQGLTEAKGVFPGVAQGQKWYDWYTHEAITAQPGQNVTIPAPLGHIPVYIRGGSVLPMQEAKYTTNESRNSSWSLIAALTANGAANGQVYIDDGESLVQNATLTVDFAATNGSLYASGRGLYEDKNKLANITVLGVQSQPAQVSLNGQQVQGVDYNGTSKVLSVTGLESLTSEGAWAQDWVLKWN